MDKNRGVKYQGDMEIQHLESEMKKSLMGAVIQADVEVKTDTIQTITDHKLCSIINHHREVAPL